MAPASRASARALGALAIAGVLATAGVWAYAPSFAGVLLLDDTASIATNPAIRRLWPPSSLLDIPRETTVSGRPVANASLAVNYALAPAAARDIFDPGPPGAGPDRVDRFLANVWGYHLGNLLIHIAAGLTLLGVVRRTLASARMPSAVSGAAGWLAAAVAAIWLVHPLQTSAVTYVVQRVESLMGLFYLLTLYCAIRAREGSHARAWAIAAVASCALAAGTKETAVTAPLIVVCWDVVFGEQRASRRGPLYAGLFATWAILAVLVAGRPRTLAVGFDLEGWTPWTYLLTQSGVILHYLKLSVVPAPLVFLYAWPMATSIAEVALSLGFVTLLVVAAVAGLLRRHPLGFAGVWFFAILAPTSSVLPIITEVAAEHRLYLPLAAVITCTVAGAYLLGRAALARLVRDAAVRVRVGAGLGALLTAALVLTLGAETRARNHDYENQTRLWEDTIAKQPSNPRAWVGYGVSLMADARYADAEAALRTAIRLDDKSPLAYGRLGAAELAVGKVDAAIGHLETAVAMWPTYADAHRSLGLAYAARHDDAQAFRHFSSALQSLPNDPMVLSRLAEIAASSADGSLHSPPLALELLERAVRVTSRQDPRLLDQLAFAQAGMEQFDAAVATSAEALRVAQTRGDAAIIAALEHRLAAFQALAKSRPPRS